MQTKIVYLTPRTTFRNSLRSDTLWGHLCWAIRNVYGEQKLVDFIANSPFIVSSTFPFLTIEGERTPFFPSPLQAISKEKIEEKLSFPQKLAEMTQRKKEKKSNTWLSLADFQRFINGEKIEKNESKLIPKQESIAVTHNRIDRIKGSTLMVGNTGQLFHIEEFYFPQTQAGLYFLAKGTDFSLLEGALRYLNHIGLGGDRHTGKGSFSISEPEILPLQEPTNANALTNLSLFHPTESELDWLKDQVAHYQLEDRQGRVGFVNLNIRKKALMFFKEGATFPYTSQTDFGQNVSMDLPQLSHKVYQYGKALMIKMNLKNY